MIIIHHHLWKLVRYYPLHHTHYHMRAKWLTSLLFPSIDTASNMLGFCIYLLCKYPEKQQFIYEKELSHVFVARGYINNIHLTENILLKLPYFRAFIFETMRIYPTTPVSAVRYLNNDDEAIQIKISEHETYQLNSNIVFSINSIGIGRNPKYWVQNQKDIAKGYANVDMMDINFDFWLDANDMFKANKSLTIFGKERRQCIGKQVAIRNMYVVLSALMLRYKFSVSNHKNWKIPCENSVLYAPGMAEINIRKRDDQDIINIQISEKHIQISEAGYDEINGDYRWFSDEKRWNYLKEHITYSMQNNVDVRNVYQQWIKLQAANANFKWGRSKEKSCCAMKDRERKISACCKD